MSDGADVDAGVVVAEDKQMDKKGDKLEESGLLADQMTVMMTDKVPTLSTPCKGENKELNLSEWEQIRKENERRAQEMKGKKVEKKGKEEGKRGRIMQRKRKQREWGGD